MSVGAYEYVAISLMKCFGLLDVRLKSVLLELLIVDWVPFRSREVIVVFFLAVKDKNDKSLWHKKHKHF